MIGPTREYAINLCFGAENSSSLVCVLSSWTRDGSSDLVLILRVIRAYAAAGEGMVGAAAPCAPGTFLGGQIALGPCRQVDLQEVVRCFESFDLLGGVCIATDCRIATHIVDGHRMLIQVLESRREHLSLLRKRFLRFRRREERRSPACTAQYALKLFAT